MSIKKVWKDAEPMVMTGHPEKEGRLEGRQFYFTCASVFIKSVYYFYHPIFYLKNPSKLSSGPRSWYCHTPSPAALSFLLILAKHHGDGQAQSLASVI